MNSYGNVDVKSIENKAYQSIETDKAKELIERLNKENILFYARYDEKKAMLQFDRSSLDKINSVVKEFDLQPEKAPETISNEKHNKTPENDINYLSERIYSLNEQIKSKDRDLYFTDTMDGTRQITEEIKQLKEEKARLETKLEQLVGESKIQKVVSQSEKAPEPVQKQEVKQQQLSPASERDKLLPVLEAMTQHQEKKAENLKEKITTKQNKISKNQTKVTALTEKSARLRQNNAILRTMSKNSTFPAIRHFIERKIDKNESRIAKIENEKIPGRKEKIAKHTKSVDKLQSKLNRSYSKIRHNTHLSNLISSFGVINRAERHERFMDALVGLNADAIDRTAAKANKCSVKIEKLTERYNQTTIAAEKFSINEKLQQLKAKQATLSAKADRLHDAHGSYLDILNNKNIESSDKLIENSSKAIDKAIHSDKATVTNMIDSVCSSNADVVLDNPLRAAEMSMEQNNNMIDGVINNLPPDTEEQERKADVPPEHSAEEDRYAEVLPMIAETLDMSVSQVESLPEELREMAAIAYMNNTDMPKDDLKELLSHTLELTPQAADIHIEPIKSDKNEKIKETADDVRTSFSRAVQRDFSEKAAEHSESPDYTQNKNKDRQITL